MIAPDDDDPLLVYVQRIMRSLRFSRDGDHNLVSQVLQQLLFAPDDPKRIIAVMRVLEIMASSGLDEDDANLALAMLAQAHTDLWIEAIRGLEPVAGLRSTMTTDTVRSLHPTWRA